MKAKLTAKTVALAFQLCVSNLGKSKYHKFFPLLDIQEYDDEYMGLYCPNCNVIYIYLTRHKSVYDLVSTVIHEYTHYLQPCDETYDILMKRLNAKGLGYNDHPMEIEAYKMEDIYAVDFLKQIEANY